MVELIQAFGGLKGTYYASFTHTAVIFLALLIFMWKIYVGPSDIGSAAQMHKNLICASHRQVPARSIHITICILVTSLLYVYQGYRYGLMPSFVFKPSHPSTKQRDFDIALFIPF